MKKTFFISKFEREEIANMEAEIQEKYYNLLKIAKKIRTFFDHDLRGEYEFEWMFLNDLFLDYAFAVNTKKLELEKLKTETFAEMRKNYKYIGEVDKAVEKILVGEIEIVGRAVATTDKYSKKILGLTRGGDRLHSHDIQEGRGITRTA